MIDFRVLGPLELKGPDGEEILSVLSQGKRVALLTYLALATDQGFRRRDTIIGLFWPEMDQERARAALRKSLHFLRRSLGEKALRTRGDEDVALDGTKVRCDAVEFEGALGRGETERALDLYRGDLLEGFFIAGSPEFERWLDEERERIREAAAGAAWEMAHRLLSCGEVTDGERMGQRALALVPTDENEVQRFLSHLSEAGDRAAAVRFYEKFERILEDLLGLPPAPETQALAEEIRGRTEARPAAWIPSSPEDPDTSPIPSPSSPPPSVSSADRDRGPRRRPPWIWAVGIFGLAAIVGGVLLGPRYFAGAPPPSPGGPGGIVLAVMPFAILSPEPEEGLSETIATLLAMELDGAGGIRTVDRFALFPQLRGMSAGGRTPVSDAREVARGFGASHFILGEAIGDRNGGLTISAITYAVDERREAPQEHLTTIRDSLDLSGLITELAQRLLPHLPVPPGQRLSGIASFTSDSEGALEAYLRGEAQLLSTRYLEAFDSFDDAVREDPSFALAHYRKSLAAVMILRFDEAALSADRAEDHANRLKDRERRLVDAWGLLIDGASNEAERRFQTILADYRDEVEAHFGLGTSRVYFNPTMGKPVGEAEAQFRDVLRLQPGFGQAIFHLLEFAASRRDTLAFDTLLARVDSTSDQALAWDAVRAFWLGGPEEQGQIEERITLSSDPLEAGLAVGRVAAFLHDFRSAERLASVLVTASQDEETIAAAHLLLAMARLAQGRWDAGMVALDDAGRFSPAWAVELKALFDGFPFRTATPEELEEIREMLEVWDPQQVGLSASPVLSAHNGWHEYLRAYLLSLTAARAGDVAQARALASRLEDMPRASERRAIVRSWAQGIQARAFLLEGEETEALRLLSTARANVPLWLISISPFFSRSFDRFALGELLVRVGRDEDALRWFASLTEGHELVLVAPALFRMAEIEERRGNAAQAAALYARFADLWAAADDRFRPLVEAAKERALPSTADR